MISRRTFIKGLVGGAVMLLPERRIWALDRTMLHPPMYGILGWRGIDLEALDVISPVSYGEIPSRPSDFIFPVPHVALSLRFNDDLRELYLPQYDQIERAVIGEYVDANDDC